MSGAMISPDPVSPAVIEARQKFAEERRARILDPRSPGVDYSALKGQIAEKKATKAAEAAEDERIAATLREYERLAIVNDREQAALRTARLKDVVQYRLENQRLEQRDGYTAEQGPDVDEAACGVSSLQKFDGEDDGFEERRKLQGLQTMQWTREAEVAVAEAAAAAAATAQTEHATMIATISAVESEQRRGDQLRATAREAVKESNIIQAAERREKDRQERLRREELDRLDKEAQLSGPLDEDPSKAFYNGKILTDRFKGFSPDQLAEIQETQKQQVIESKTRKGAANAESREFVNIQTKQAQQILLADRQAARTRKAIAAEQAAENLRLAEERRGAKGVPAGVVTTNQIDDSFFSQFGRSHR